jgi:hypothetical protein
MKIFPTLLILGACAALGGCASFAAEDSATGDAAPVSAMPMSAPMGHGLSGGWSADWNSPLANPRMYMDAPDPNLQKLSAGFR